MFAHGLNPLKGWWQDAALDFTGVLHSAVTISPFPAGRCVHVATLTAQPWGPGTIGKKPNFKTGVTGTQMPLFTFQGSEDFDVENDGGTDWYAVAPRGFINTLVATGGYELETTEYDTEQTYLANDVLKAVADDIDDDDETGGGCLTNDATVYLDAIVGVVSRGAYTNAYGKAALAFWPVYLPANPCNAEGEPCGPQELS